MKKYKVYVIIESGDEDDEQNGEMREEVDETVHLATFQNLSQAAALKERLADCVTDDGEVLHVPPAKLLDEEEVLKRGYF